ncbi:MAG: ATP synthase F1 subunit gamma [Thermodesulfovibrionia bacterium]|nr:ATP synthase F1 subunit gamma [Thermodesulfovibrionia bacterium]
MATLRDIKRRITAVKSTKQITKAMKMVAAAKLRRAQNRMIDMRPYADKMNSVIASMTGGEAVHPLLVKRPRKTVEILILSSDRGLCGAYNTNIIKAAEKIIATRHDEKFNVSISIVGKKAADYYKRRDIEIRKSWVGLSGKLTYTDAQEIGSNIVESYVNETIDEVFIIYNKFVTVMNQEVTVKKLMPVSADASDAAAEEPSTVFIFEPSQKEILNQLLPKNVEVQIYRALLESQASEEAARMTAMENATQNADEMIERLTLQYNKARQATITKELMDIVGGVEALKD